VRCSLLNSDEQGLQLEHLICKGEVNEEPEAGVKDAEGSIDGG
jgi:hypothetical protein